MKPLPYFLILIALLLFAACGEEPGPSPEPDLAEAQEERVRVEDFAYSRLPGGARVLTGVLYNPTETPIENAQIQVSLYDADNRRISSMVIRVRGVPAGERRAFREYVGGDIDREAVHGARVRSVLVL